MPKYDKYAKNLIVKAIRLFDSGWNNSAVSSEIGVPRTTVIGWRKKSEELALNWQDIDALPPKEFSKTFFGFQNRNLGSETQDLRSHFLNSLAPGSSVLASYQDYLNSPSDEPKISMPSFYRKFRAFKREHCSKGFDTTIHQSFYPGQAMQIDYSGDGMKVVVRGEDGKSKVVTYQIFVACFAYSGYILAVLTPRQTRKDWLTAIDKCFEEAGGVPLELMLDNSTSLVLKADKYDPELCSEFKEFCERYNVSGHAVAPGRPTFKPYVERAVGLIQKEINKQLGGRKSVSLEEGQEILNSACYSLNHQPLADLYETTRAERFESEKSCLKPLPVIRITRGPIIKQLKVQKGNQVRIKGIRYSVQWGYVGEIVDVVYLKESNELEFIVHDSGKYIGKSRLRNHLEGHEPTKPEDVPVQLRHYAENREELIKDIGVRFGPKTQEMASRIANQNNSRAITHLRGIIDYGNKFGDQSAALMEDVSRKVLGSPSKPTFKGFMRCWEEIRKEKNLNPVLPTSYKRTGYGSKIPVKESSYIRGAEHYAKQCKALKN